MICRSGSAQESKGVQLRTHHAKNDFGRGSQRKEVTFGVARTFKIELSPRLGLNFHKILSFTKNRKNNKKLL